MWRQTNLPAGFDNVAATEIIMMLISRWQNRSKRKPKKHFWYVQLSCLHGLSHSLLNKVSLCLSFPLPFLARCVLSDSLGLAGPQTIFKFITILVAVLLTSTAKIYPPPSSLLPFISLSSNFLGVWGFNLFIYLFIYSVLLLMTFFPTLQSLGRNVLFFFNTTNYQFPIGVWRHYLLN